MGLYSYIKTAIVNRRLTSDDRWIDRGQVWPYQPPASGVRVTPVTALQNAAVWACHRFLTQTVAQLPVRVMRERADGTSERVLTHPVVNVFTWRANGELSPFQLKETLTGWALRYGNGVAEIERDMRGGVAAIWPIHPDRVFIQRDMATDELVYWVSNGSMGSTGSNGSVPLRPMDVLHIRGFGDGPVGMSVIEHAAESIGWAQATELFGASFFGNGLAPSGVIEGALALNADGQKRLRAELSSTHGGPRRAHKALFLDKGMTWKAASVNPDEAQFIETLNFQVVQVARWFGVPPHKIAQLDRATFSNIEEQNIEVVVDSITPWAIRWEEEANYKLFGQNRLNLFVKFDLKGLLRGDFKSRQEGLQIMRRSGVVNADEWRELEDMGPMANKADGQKYSIEANMTTLGALGEAPPAAPKTPAPASEAPPASTEPAKPATKPPPNRKTMEANRRLIAEARKVLVDA